LKNTTSNSGSSRDQLAISRISFSSNEKSRFLTMMGLFFFAFYQNGIRLKKFTHLARANSA